VRFGQRGQARAVVIEGILGSAETVHAMMSGNGFEPVYALGLVGKDDFVGGFEEIVPPNVPGPSANGSFPFFVASATASTAAKSRSGSKVRAPAARDSPASSDRSIENPARRFWAPASRRARVS
jgi:hypothetical protein